MKNADGSRKTDFEARRELSVVLVRQRSLAGFNGSDDLALAAGVDASVVRYVRDQQSVGPRPTVEDVRKVFGVFSMTPAFSRYVGALIDMTFSVQSRPAVAVCAAPESRGAVSLAGYRARA